MIAAAAIGVATTGWFVSAPVASAECVGPNTVIMGHGGGRCDHPSDQPDGSFVRCDTTYVFGFGGTNCYRVAAGTP
ncbi:hypothetical protein MFAL_27710 [Mycolicibacterium fallax]|jgi:hypothetical protein|nr:hypothetical protein MFAL_27710 [Mycolicibacterium fallax]HSA39014.1 hypothetical protein [Mycobacterium sp.]